MKGYKRLKGAQVFEKRSPHPNARILGKPDPEYSRYELVNYWLCLPDGTTLLAGQDVQLRNR